MVTQEPASTSEMSLQYVNENCWRRPFVQELITSSCTRLSDETRSRLALAITNCHLEASGLEGVECGAREPVQSCRRKVGQSPVAFQTYTTCYYGVDSMCYFMLRDRFQQSTEEAINGLYSAGLKSVETMYGLRDSMQEFAAEERARFVSLQSQGDALQAQQKDGLEHMAKMNASVFVQHAHQKQLLKSTTNSVEAQRERQEELLVRSSAITETLTAATPLVEGVVQELGAVLQQVGGLRAGMQSLQRDLTMHLVAGDQLRGSAAYFYGQCALAALAVSTLHSQRSSRWPLLVLTALTAVLERSLLELMGSLTKVVVYQGSLLGGSVVDPRLAEWLQSNYHQTRSFIGARLFNDLDLHSSTATTSLPDDLSTYWVPVFRAMFQFLFIAMCLRSSFTVTPSEEHKLQLVVERLEDELKMLNERIDMVLRAQVRYPHLQYNQHKLELYDDDNDKAMTTPSRLIEPETTPLSIKSQAHRPALVPQVIEDKQKEKEEDNVFQQARITTKATVVTSPVHSKPVAQDNPTSLKKPTVANNAPVVSSKPTKRKANEEIKTTSKKPKSSALVEDDMGDN